MVAKSPRSPFEPRLRQELSGDRRERLAARELAAPQARSFEAPDGKALSACLLQVATFAERLQNREHCLLEDAPGAETTIAVRIPFVVKANTE